MKSTQLRRSVLTILLISFGSVALAGVWDAPGMEALGSGFALEFTWLWGVDHDWMLKPCPPGWMCGS
ncbi:MAG: hypothetical protein AAF771_12100 [Pseudomonadota bacterium]